MHNYLFVDIKDLFGYPEQAGEPVKVVDQRGLEFIAENAETYSIFVVAPPPPVNFYQAGAMRTHQSMVADLLRDVMVEYTGGNRVKAASVLSRIGVVSRVYPKQGGSEIYGNMAGPNEDGVWEIKR